MATPDTDSILHRCVRYLVSQNHQGFEKLLCPPSSYTLWFQSLTWYLTPNWVGVQNGYDHWNRLFYKHLIAPFIPSFSITCFVAAGNFVLISQHTSPDSAVKEIDALYDVVADVRHRWNTNVNVLLHTSRKTSHHSQNSNLWSAGHSNTWAGNGTNWTIALARQDILLLGDLNAGCTYVTGSKWQHIRLFTDKSFHWLISDDADTTVTHTNCPYDRCAPLRSKHAHPQMQTLQRQDSCVSAGSWSLLTCWVEWYPTALRSTTTWWTWSSPTVW